MNLNDFDKLMGRWIENEMEQAPDLIPSESVYKKVKAKQKKAILFFFPKPARWAIAGACATALLFIVILSSNVFKSGNIAKQEMFADFVPPSTSYEAEADKSIDEQSFIAEAPSPALKSAGGVKEQVRQEETTANRYARETLSASELGQTAPSSSTSLKDRDESVLDAQDQSEIKVETEAPSEYFAAQEQPTVGLEIAPRETQGGINEEKVVIQPGEAQRRKQIALDMVSDTKTSAAKELFKVKNNYFQQSTPGQAIKTFEINEKQEMPVTISPNDNYRILLQFEKQSWVYIFQQNEQQQLVKLFPNQSFSNQQNPIRPFQQMVFPDSNWLHSQNIQGKQTIYILASSEPQDNLDRLYNKYVQTKKISEANKILTNLQSSQKTDSTKTMLQQFQFEIQ